VSGALGATRHLLPDLESDGCLRFVKARFSNGSGREAIASVITSPAYTQADISMERHFRYMAAIPDFLAELFVNGLEAYFATGVLFALTFVFRVQRFDSEAEGTGVGFRFLIAPGVAALWPLFLYRYLRHSAEPPLEKNAHRLAANKP